MAPFQFPRVNIWGEAPATPARVPQSPETEFDNGPQTPCAFMPQSSAPVMILSSTTRRSRKSVDERAIRLLLPTRNGFQDAEYYPDDEGEEYDEEEGEDEHEDGNTLADQNTSHTYRDINMTPITPPKSPLTPTTNTSLTSRTSVFSIASFTAIAIHLRISRRGVRALLLLIAVVLSLLTAIPLSGTEGLQNRLVDLVGVVWTVLVFLSEVAEIAIECVGFTLGKVAARFGRGFERGYRM